MLRDELGLNGAKFGCGLGQCGACTVMVDGEPVFSCLMPISALQGRKITTIEGLGTPEKPGPLQRAFIEEQAAQCGYCIAGMMMRAQALLDANPHADRSRDPQPHGSQTCAAAAPTCGSCRAVRRAARRDDSGARRRQDVRPMMSGAHLSRARVLAGGGALVVGFSLRPRAGGRAQGAGAGRAGAAGQPARPPMLDAWIRIDADGSDHGLHRQGRTGARASRPR